MSEQIDRKNLIDALGKIDPKKPYGTELFDALARLTVSVAVEAVCLKRNSFNKGVEVHLVQRSQDETAYPGQWHCPGSVMRPGEELQEVFNRLVQELGGIILSSLFVANVNHPMEARGHFLSLVYLCALEQSNRLKGTWFSIDQLPVKMIESHRHRIIPVAVGAFVAANKSIYV